MRNLNKDLENRTIDNIKLIEYGFINNDDNYYYEKNILSDTFKIVIEINKEKQISKVIDLSTNEEFILVDVKNAVGDLLGQIKEEYENVLSDIISSCTILDVFKSKQSKSVINYIKEKYNDELEFLWEKYDNCAVSRNKINDKWYMILMKIERNKICGYGEDIIEIIDLRYQKGDIDKIIDNKRVYSGYHMNKKSWITIILDDNPNIDNLLKLIDNSYDLSIGKIDKLSKKVYEYLTTIPEGKVVTYGQVATHLGNKGLARIVGTILHNNPDGDKYPCYKVLNSKGELADEFVFGGKEAQKERLEKDGIKVIDFKVDLKKYQWKD